MVSPDQLFQMNAASGLSCDDWLGQQVVLFDGKGISLKEMIRTVVNFEGSHSISVGRLSTIEGEVASRAAKNPAPHILNAVTVCGIRYAHLIVIECALYLYEKLLEERSIPTAGRRQQGFQDALPASTRTCTTTQPHDALLRLPPFLMFRNFRRPIWISPWPGTTVLATGNFRLSRFVIP